MNIGANYKNGYKSMLKIDTRSRYKGPMYSVFQISDLDEIRITISGLDEIRITIFNKDCDCSNTKVKIGGV